MSPSLALVVLAAGKGTRMGGKFPKVLAESFCGPLIHEILLTSVELSPTKLSLVVGFQAEQVENSVRAWVSEHAPTCQDTLSFCIQKEQNGTGDAVKAALPSLQGFQGEVLILCGDTPLLTAKTLQQLIAKHREERSTVSVLTTQMAEPAAYGRIIRSEDTGSMIAIREARDASATELLTTEINSGVYVVDSGFLPGALQQLETDNAQGEFYLTDIVKRAVDEGQTVSTLLCPSSEEIHGVNTYQDLHLVNSVQQRRIRDAFALQGVRFIHPESVIIDPSAKISAGVEIGPSTVVGANVTVGENVKIEGLSQIIDSTIASGATIKWGCRIESATVGESSSVGPFAHLRPQATLGKEVKVGNFVEVKKSTLEDGAKASHLTYLGDAVVGKEANIGAGTITCNYDGYQKSPTTIGAGAFIGSNSSLVAPVSIGENATIGAGSTVSKDVSAGALGLTRAEQREFQGWSEKKRKRAEKVKK
jgi:bifunctional UDP-N-acetylglucosamine pyrophosphorylase/glucosamine-1-phosphate N-acetyltransferase